MHSKEYDCTCQLASYLASCIVLPAILLIFRGRGSGNMVRGLHLLLELGQKRSSECGNGVRVWRASHVDQPRGCRKMAAVAEILAHLVQIHRGYGRYVTESSIRGSLNLELLGQ